MKNVSVLKEDAAFAVFFRPTLGDLTAQKSPPPEFAIQGKKKNANARGSARGGGGTAGRRLNWLMHTSHLNTQTKRDVTTVVHTNIQEN